MIVGLLAAVLPLGAAQAAGGREAVIIRENTHWRVFAVRGPMRLNGHVLKDEKTRKQYDLTRRTLSYMQRHTKRLLAGQNLDWKKHDWRDHAVYCPDQIGNPYFPRMMSLVVPEYPPADWMKRNFDDSNWTTLWNTKVRGNPGKGSVYTRDLYLRTYFEVPDPSQAVDLQFTVSYRGGARVFVNGRELGRAHLPEETIDESTCGAPYPGEAYYNRRDEIADTRSVVSIGEIWTRFIKGGRSKDPRLRRYRCPAPPQWNGYKGPWLNRKGWNRLMKLRDRRLGPLTVPARLLKKGRNVLALEIRGSLHHPLIYAPGKWSHGKSKQWNESRSWDHCRLVRLSLTDPSGTLPSAAEPPDDFHVWVEDMHLRMYDYGHRPAAMPTGKLTFVGALNGSFSGMLTLFSGKTVKGLSVTVNNLKHTKTDAVLSRDRVTVAAMTGEPLGDMAQLGVHIKGLGDRPMNPMSRDALTHVLHSPFFHVPRDRDRDWWEHALWKVRFYDHIGSGLPQSVPANRLQPLWVRLDVPMGAEPGTYRGAITVRADGVEPVTVPVEAEIIGWRVPEPNEFLTDMGLVHHPYAVANHYLLPTDSPVKPGDRDWRGPVRAGVPLWSDEHFRLLEDSFKQMARAGNDVLFIPVLHRTEFGNWEDSMIRWIRKKDGSYDFDFSILDRFLDLALRHMGRPRVICFVIMHCQLASPPPAVTVYDEATGKHERLTLGWKQDTFNRLAVWRQFGAAVLAHMRKRGLERSVYWGHGGDHESDPALMGFFWEVFPNHYWAASGHTYHGGAGGGGHSRNVVRYFADVYGAASPIESKKGWKGGYIGGRPSVTIGKQYARSSIGKAERLVRNETYLYPHIPRDELRGAAHPIRWRGIPSVSLHRGYSGLGHIGFDSYHHNYLDGYTGHDWAFPGRPHQMMVWPGPKGAEPSARYEALLEGIQECEARIFLEQAEDRGLLSDAMAARVKDTLLDYLHHYCLWPQLRSDTVYDYIHDWQGDSRKLFRLAAEVAGIVGVDIDQTNLRTRVAALGRNRRRLLLRNWTGKPRRWEARTDADWLRLDNTRGSLLGFQNLAYAIDGKTLKPGQTVEGRIYVKDLATGHEQAFTVIADVIDPIELRCDHANFNLRCGQARTRKFRVVSHAAVDVNWKLAAQPPWLTIRPSGGTIPGGEDLFVTCTAAPPDKTAATYDNHLVFSGARGLVDKPIDSKTFVIPLLREKEGRKMPYGKIVKLRDMGKRWTFFGTCLKGTKIETGQVREIGKAHTTALTNPSEGPPAQRHEFLPIIGNERFSRAMWVYPHHRSVFHLEGSRIRAFSAYVGVSNDARRRLIRNQHRKVNFEIWVDGKIVTQSGLMKTTSSARYLTVENLEGAKELKLVTRLDSNKDDNTFLCCWCDCNFYATEEEKDKAGKEAERP
jgi:hypothetical protein